MPMSNSAIDAAVERRRRRELGVEPQPSIAQGSERDPISSVVDTAMQRMGERRAREARMRQLATPDADRGLIGDTLAEMQRGWQQGREATATATGGVTGGIDVEQVADARRRMREIRPSAEMADFNEVSGFWSSLGKFAKNPIDIGIPLVAGSMASLARTAPVTMPPAIATGVGVGAGVGSVVPGVGTAAGAATGLRAGMSAGYGLTSAALEYSGKLYDMLDQMGVDTTDPNQIRMALATPSIRDEVVSKARAKAIPIALLDALSAGVAGRVATPAREVAGEAIDATLFGSRKLAATKIGRRLAETETGRWGTELAAQAGAGMAGEAAGEVASGEPISWPSIMGEGIGELVPGVGEVAIGRAFHGLGTRPRIINGEVVGDAAPSWHPGSAGAPSDIIDAEIVNRPGELPGGMRPFPEPGLPPSARLLPGPLDEGFVAGEGGMPRRPFPGEIGRPTTERMASEASARLADLEDAAASDPRIRMRRMAAEQSELPGYDTPTDLPAIPETNSELMGDAEVRLRALEDKIAERKMGAAGKLINELERKLPGLSSEARMRMRAEIESMARGDEEPPAAPAAAPEPPPTPTPVNGNGKVNGKSAAPASRSENKTESVQSPRVQAEPGKNYGKFPARERPTITPDGELLPDGVTYDGEYGGLGEPAYSLTDHGRGGTSLLYYPNRESAADAISRSRKEAKTNAEGLRGNEGQVRGGGDEPQGREGQGGADLEQPASGEPGGEAQRQESKASVEQGAGQGEGLREPVDVGGGMRLEHRAEQTGAETGHPLTDKPASSLYKITRNGEDVATIRVDRSPDGTAAELSVTSKGGPGTLGAGTVARVRKALAAQFPDVKIWEGDRISGARQARGGAKNGVQKVSVSEPKSDKFFIKAGKKYHADAIENKAEAAGKSGNTGLKKGQASEFASADEWLQNTRFYRSGRFKNAELPDGERVFLNSSATAKNFREVSGDFIRSRWEEKTKAQKKKSEETKKGTSNKKFFIRAGGKFHEVEGNPVTVKGFEDVDLFVGKDVSGKGYSVTEGRTGAAIGRGGTEEAAIAHATKSMKRAGKESMVASIDAMVKKHGLTPRYTGEAEAPKAPKKSTKTEDQIPEKKAAGKPAAGERPARRHQAAVEVFKALKAGEGLDSKALIAIVDKEFGGTRASGAWAVRDMHDALELGINEFVQRNQLRVNPADPSPESAVKAIKFLQERVLERIPTQTVRSEEQNEFQQFSTPPDLAFTAAWVGALEKADGPVLEPSAGNGALVVMASNAEPKGSIIANELSPERRANLTELDAADEVRGENAEQIANIWKGKDQPDTVLMNPPFSATAGRVKGKRSNTVGQRYVEQALEHLAEGGRAVIISGRGMDDNRPAMASWWKKIKGEYNVRANIPIDGATYRKFGTNFDVQLIVIDKTGPTEGKIVGVGLDPVADIAQLPELLAEVRDGRQRVEGTESTGEQPAGTGVAARRSEPESGRRADASGAGEGPGNSEETGSGSGLDRRAGGGRERQPRAGSGEQPGSGGGERGQRSDAGEPGGEESGGRRGAAAELPDRSTAERLLEQPTADEFFKGVDEALDEIMPAPKPKEKPKARPAKKAADGVLDNLTDAGKAGLAGLRELFGDPNMLGSGPLRFDEETYAKALPHFKAVLESVIKAGKGVRDFVVAIANQFGQAVRPYLERFVREVRDGGVRILGLNQTESPKAPSEIEIQKADAGGKHEAMDENGVFETYRPAKLQITGAKDHPGGLVESAAMASVDPPDPTYRPTLPEKVIKDGLLSLPQLESVVYAGQAHEAFLPNGRRRGFFLGDGTGVGKGRQIAGIILDNRGKGRKKAIWISEKGTLAKNAADDYADIGGNPDDVFTLMDVKPNAEVPSRDGILFSTYATMKRGEQQGKRPAPSRVDQIVQWVGKDFDGVLVFDESHNMGNADEREGERGKIEPSKTALAGIDLQEKLPKARVVYVSATGATEIENLLYATRLGLWGEGTPFADGRTFTNEIANQGLAAMEMVARDLKQMGLYLARSLDYRMVTYERLTHVLTPEQRDVYDEIGRAWQMVLADVNAALGETEADGNSKSSAMSRFWNAQIRFYEQILSAMQMPSVIDNMEAKLAQGHALVLQLVNTNEAQQNRAVGRLEEGQDLEDLDLTPRDVLMEYVKNAFPTRQYEEYEDERGVTRKRAVLDSEGNNVESAEALRMRDELLTRLGSLRVPDPPLDTIINHFGPENIAEVTGRKRRFVRKADENGDVRLTEEARSEQMINKEIQDFRDDKRRILIFSDKGGTGVNYHSDLREKNQRRRMHYVLQPGWRANKTLQGLGRTHRSNEANAPNYLLTSTDLPGHKRFTSANARKLDQVGALTRGQRQATGGIYNEADNLENRYARDAVTTFVQDLYYGQVEGMTFQELAPKMGLENLIDNEGNLNVSRIPSIQRFLNRILVLEIDEQNRVFEAFHERMMTKIEAAAERGELDTGLETIPTLRASIEEDIPVYTHKATGAETRYQRVEGAVDISRSIQPWESMPKKVDFIARYRGNKEPGPWRAYMDGGSHTARDGSVRPQYRIWGATSRGMQDKSEIDMRLLSNADKWDVVKDPKEMAQHWGEMLEALPKERKETWHFISGAILPIWDRISGQARVARIQTTDGKRVIGRLVNEQDLAGTLKRLGVEAKGQNYNPARVVDGILDRNETAELANGWRLVRRTVAGEDRIELIGADTRHLSELRKAGVFTENIQWRTRFFVPIGEGAEKTVRLITETRPVVTMTPPARTLNGGGTTVYSFPAMFFDPVVWEKMLDPVSKATRKFVDQASAALNRQIAKLPEPMQALLRERFGKWAEPREAFELKEHDELADSRLRNYFLRAIDRENLNVEEMALLDRVLRGVPQDMERIPEHVRDLAEELHGQWRSWAQEMTAHLETLGLPFREEWKNVAHFYPAMFRKHVEMNLMGRLFAKNPAPDVKPGKAAMGHTKAKYLDRFTVWSRSTGKIVRYGKEKRLAIFKTREAAESFQAQVSIFNNYANRAAAQLHRVFPGGKADARAFIERALQSYPEIKDPGPIKGEARKGLRRLAEGMFPGMSKEQVTTAIDLIPGARNTGAYFLLEPMPHDMQVARGLIENPLFNIGRGMKNVSQLVRRTQFLDALGGMKVDDDIPVATLDNEDGMDRVRLSDMGLTLPKGLYKKVETDKTTNANVRALAEGYVLRDVAEGLVATFGHSVGLAGKTWNWSERNLRASVTYRNPYRHLKQPIENELQLYLANARDFIDVKARVAFTRDLIRYFKGEDVPIIAEGMDMGLHADSKASVDALDRTFFEQIDMPKVESTLSETIEKSKLSKAKDAAEWLDQKAQNLYAWEDLAYKLYYYARERGEYGSGRQATKEEAYEQVSNSFFNYDRAPRWVEQISKVTPFKFRVMHQLCRIAKHHLRTQGGPFMLKVALLGFLWAGFRNWGNDASGLDDKDKEEMGRFAPGASQVVLPVDAGNGRNLTLNLSWLIPFYNDLNVFPPEGTELMDSAMQWTPMTAQYLYRTTSGKKWPGTDVIDERTMTQAQQAARYLRAASENLPNIYGQYWWQMWDNAHKDPRWQRPYWEWLTKPATGLGTVNIDAQKDMEFRLRRQMENAQARRGAGGGGDWVSRSPFRAPARASVR